jgi:branched-chain amino acid transport system substrate-binding protein
MHRIIYYLFLIFFVCTYQNSFSQSDTLKDTGQQKVYISINVNDIDHIDTKNQTFDAEYYLWLKWSQGGRSGKRIEYMNSIETRNIMEDDWNQDSLQRFSAKVRGTFKSHFDVSNYPFDKQILKIRISDYDFKNDELKYIVETEKIALSKEIFNDEWNIKLIGATEKIEHISEEYFSVFEYQLEIKRKSFSVFIKIILPLYIIMAIAFLNLFINKKELEAGIGLGISSLLSIIALHFSIASQLPDVNYPTKVDLIFVVSFFFNLLLIVWVVLGYNWNAKEKFNLIKKVEKFIKPLMPLVYFIFALALPLLV